MAKSDGRHVVKNPSDGWDVKKPGASKPTAHADTQSDAERIAKLQVAGEGGGEVVIHSPDGRIRDSDMVAPAKDPYPPKDTKHGDCLVLQARAHARICIESDGDTGMAEPLVPRF